MKYVLILLAFAGRAALADSATCDAHTAAELRTVFAVAVGLQDAYRRTTSGSATPEYADLRAKLADYDERLTLPCAAAAAELLRTRPDALLGRSLLEVASSRTRSDSAGLAQSLARFLDARPDDFLNALAKMPVADRCALVETAESAGAASNHLANLKRLYCRDASPKPAVNSSGNRARGPSEAERHPSRTRLARVGSGDSATPVAGLV